MNVHENPSVAAAPNTLAARSGGVRWVWLLFGAACAALAFVIGWGMFYSEASGSKASSVSDNDAPIQDGQLIRFSKAFAKRAGLSSEAVAPAELSPTLTVGGTLTYDPHRFAALGARLHGRVRRVIKYFGDSVALGETVAEIESAELGRAEALVLASRAKERAAAAEAKRQRHLADAHVTSEREAELAEATFEAARAERNAAEHALAALGGSIHDRPGTLRLQSPIAGHVIRSDAAIGQIVDPTKTLFEVAELSSLWVELPVFEHDLDRVQRGNPVEISWPGMRGEPIAAEVDHVGETIDLDTRTAPVRVIVANLKRSLRPGQSVIARIHTRRMSAGSLAIPRAALTRVDGKPTVFVLHDATSVEPRQVLSGPEDASHVVIQDGLTAGERVVVGGMFAIKSELFR